MNKAFPMGLAISAALLASAALAQEPPGHDQLPGQQFHITAESLPLPEDATIPGAPSPPKQIARGDHQPILPPGFTQTLFASDLVSPRRMLVDSDNRVYLAQQSLGRLIRIRDTEGDGIADSASLILNELTQPFGLAFLPSGPFAGDLLLSNPNRVYLVPVKSGAQIAQVTPPGFFGEAAGHITREIVVDQGTSRVYVAIGSVHNLAEEGGQKATIQRIEFDGSGGTFATGLRNVTGMDFEPGTGALYGVVMERDGMGDELVPDFLTRIDEGDNFGWPYQYLGGFVQPEFREKLATAKLAAAKMPDVLFEAHSAPLDLAFIPEGWPEDYRGDALVALHGSYGAGSPTGYKVVRVPFENGRPTGGYENFMTGFWVSGDAPAEVWGRPASLAFGPDSGLYVGDDLGNTIWKVMPPKG